MAVAVPVQPRKVGRDEAIENASRAVDEALIRLEQEISIDGQDSRTFCVEAREDARSSLLPQSIVQPPGQGTAERIILSRIVHLSLDQQINLGEKHIKVAFWRAMATEYGVGLAVDTRTEEVRAAAGLIQGRTRA